MMAPLVKGDGPAEASTVDCADAAVGIARADGQQQERAGGSSDGRRDTPMSGALRLPRCIGAPPTDPTMPSSSRMLPARVGSEA
jgi:hypothetical protein